MRASSLHKHPGGCHCGNLRVVVEFGTAPGATPMRACQCSFCRAHGARTASDPAGTLKIWAQDWTAVNRYRFGTQTADLLLCRTCGVFVAAVTEAPDGVLGVVNVNVLADQAAFTQTPQPMDPDKDDSAGQTGGRSARRAATWMPAILHA